MLPQLPNLGDAPNQKQKQDVSDSSEEEENDVDEDGKPKTISAAIRIYHNNSKTRKFYCQK